MPCCRTWSAAAASSASRRAGSPTRAIETDVTVTRKLKRSLQLGRVVVQLRRWMAIGAGANAAAGAVVCARQTPPGSRLSSWLRTTGNGTFIAYAVPFVTRAGRAGRPEWWIYVGSHTPHVMGLLLAAARHRRGGGSFSAASRYGGLPGYLPLAALGATAYAPGAPPPRQPAARVLHRAGEHVLFGLYAFT